MDEFNTYYLQCQYEKSVEMFKSREEVINAHSLAIIEIREIKEINFKMSQ